MKPELPALVMPCSTAGTAQAGINDNRCGQDMNSADNCDSGLSRSSGSGANGLQDSPSCIYPIYRAVPYARTRKKRFG